MVSLQSVCKGFGHQVVFDGLCQDFYAGEKVGLIGANGSGKTTLLRLILGEIAPDSGKVVRRKGLRMGYLPQEAVFDGQRTVIAEMHAGLEEVARMREQLHVLAQRMGELAGAELKKVMAEYDRLGHEFELAGGYTVESRIKSILAGLDIGKELYDARTSALSGGQLSRLGLARVLLAETDLLLLDEPTNHVDLQATVWLERFVKSYRGAAIVISHDRYLLDRIACKIVELEGRRSTTWKGNYSNYAATKEKVLLQQQREYERRREMVERTRDFVARNKDREGMRKTARGRKKRLDRLLLEQPDYLDKPTQNRGIKFGFANARSKSELVLRCEGLSMVFGSLVLFEDLDIDLLRGERLGITGPNGTGKSTFVKMALGQIKPTKGSIRLGPTLSVGYLDQHAGVLNGDKTVLDEVRSVRPDLTEEVLRGRLGAFLFSAEDVFKKVGNLSGGEQNRLLLCTLVLGEPDLLVLDEPTNHLDITSREMLEEALSAYSGAVILVSHDRYLLDRAVDKLLVLGVDEFGNRAAGRREFITGQNVYTLYADKVRKRLAEKQLTQPKPCTEPTGKAGKKARSAVATELKPFNKYTVEQIEDMIVSLEEKVAELHEEFGEAKYYQNPELLQSLQKRLKTGERQLALLYRAYEMRL